MIKWIKSGYKIIIIKQYCSFIFENDYECKRKYLKISKCFRMLIVQQWLFSKVWSCFFFTSSFIFSIFKWWYRIYKDFPGGPVVKNPPCNAEDVGSIPGWGTTIPTCHRANN